MEYSTKSAIAYRELKRMILSGELSGGSWLRLKETADLLGMSESPVREAFRQLDAEGLTRNAPHRGTRVESPSVSDLFEIVLIRNHLESLATRLNAHHVTTDQVSCLQNLARVMDKHLKNEEAELYAEKNREFHMAIYGAGPHPLLLQLISDLWARAREKHAMRMYTFAPEWWLQTQDEHHRIIEAISIGDIRAAGDLMQSHKLAACRILGRILLKTGEAPAGFEPVLAELIGQEHTDSNSPD